MMKHYSDEQREEVGARLQRFQDEQKAMNDQIRILKGRYSNQIYQIRESIMKFFDKETGTLGERMRTLFKEQGITIVSILTALYTTLSERKIDGSVRYTHIKLTRAKGYFTHDINGGGDNMFTADSICEMIEFLIDNIFVQFGGRLFRQVIGIPMGTNCAPLLADLFLYSYENEFLDNMIRSGHRRLARSFNLCYRYIDDLIVFNNKKFLDYLKEI